MVLLNEGGSDPKVLHVQRRPDGYRLVYRGTVLGVPMSARGARSIARETLSKEEQALERLERTLHEQKRIVERLRADVAAIEAEVA